MSREPDAKTIPFGKYNIVRELGRGGMGVVYEAIDAGLQRRVALKTMIVHPQIRPADAKLDEERFLREAQLSARLPKHPNIVGVYEAGVIEGRRYLAMELIEGIPMSEWWTGELVTLRHQVEVLRTAALAVHHAHEHDVIHRDLKPQNILIDARNQPHITDFGLAKIVGQNLNLSLTGAGMVVGTPAYISPEQAQGLRTTDRRTDVYALGVILFEILTGRHPFQGETAVEILLKASKNPVPSASNLMKVRLTPEQAKGLDDICQKALAKKPADRYRSAAAFAADLTQWLSGGPVKVSVATRRAMRPQDKPWGAILAVAAILVVLGIYFLGSGPSRKIEPDAPVEVKKADEKKAEEEKLRLERDRLEAEQRAAEARAKAAEGELQAMKARVLKPVAVKNPQGLRPGLVAEYFSGINFDIPCLRRIDPDIHFTLVKGGSAWPTGPTEMISARWRGYFRVSEKGPHLFHAWGGDGVRLFIDDTEVIARWVPHEVALETGVAFLEPGLHQFVLEAFCTGPPGAILFSWKRTDDPGKPATGVANFVHDPSTFSPLSQPPTNDRFDWLGLPGAQEAEALSVLYGAAGSYGVLPFGRNHGILIWGKGTKIGDHLKFGFDSSKAGEHTLILAMSRVKNAGIFRIAVNGTVVAERLDLYHPGNHMLESEFRKVALRKGQNELEFTVVGSNPAAVEWRTGEGKMRLAFDYLRIR